MNKAIYWAERVDYHALALHIVTITSLAVGRFHCTILPNQQHQIVSFQLNSPYTEAAVLYFVLGGAGYICLSRKTL